MCSLCKKQPHNGNRRHLLGILLDSPLLALLDFFIRQGKNLLHPVPPLLTLFPLQTALLLSYDNGSNTSTFADFSVLLLEYHSLSTCSPSGHGNTESSCVSRNAYKTHLYVDWRTLSKNTQLRRSAVRFEQILQIRRHHVLDKQLDTCFTNQARSPRIAYSAHEQRHAPTVTHLVLHVVRFRYGIAANQALLILLRFLVLYPLFGKQANGRVDVSIKTILNEVHESMMRIVGIGG